MKYASLLKIVSPFFLILALLPSTLVQTGCANMAPPTGGARDSLPPRLMGVNPHDSARNFTGKKITIEFDEFVQIENIQENLLVSPVPKVNPVVESKLRTVTVTVKDTLQPNTTYTIDFGNAIKDINEGNILKNFTYLFSTGSNIDSLKLTGKVIIAETGKTDSTLIVMLHRSSDDSAIIKEKPRYIARVDKDGNYNFKNLPADSFSLYAMKDDGGQRRYMSNSQLIAFADERVFPGISPKSMTLYAFTEKEDTTKAKSNKPATAQPAKPAPPQAAKPTNGKKDKTARLQVETNLTNNELDLLSPFELRFGTELKTFDSTKVILANDKNEPLSNYHFTRDTSKKKITVSYAWIENTPYKLIVDKDFAEDSAGGKIGKNDTIEFRTKKQSDYGLVRLRLINLDFKKNPVLQFVSGDQVKYSYPLSGREFNAKLFQPGEYDLRILYDDNKNGVWDTGAFFGHHKQPEKVLPISRKLTVKANWDNIVDITL
ncbi:MULTISPECIES: Ig-like domain-containing protein [Niastella]|uniref:Ig-like domain-containing protein n=1 Tax=Niastella soli TaxID=2821487 RepID=A0ABS3YNG0_9BACT|nr:Ig-like domain-containing protein [Niastella soli]MBO9199432.1 Ig-like domain-containing protein [Niastella soli]